ncbi:MAG: universal stress protein [Salana multivorans]|uniref:universal stress protein n=1 Tax=Salana multivorans TaxID=120377 RepID=UPI00095BCEB0|nr:universal stress protein [Salana multivorans]MBN8883486.1 universal stress protein [Salana multivorans]OJX96979.1 MAG: hypothetical protein BGO96_02660 [Micrococcales bacterium 73-15]
MTDPTATPASTADAPATVATAGTILVGVDAETPSLRALEWALRRAARTGARVVAAWTVTSHESDDDAERALTERLREARVAVEALDAADPGPRPDRPDTDDQHPDAPARPALEAELLHGDVVGSLLARAATADLLVIGTNYTPSVVGRLRGTRALKLADDAPVPVVIVPDVELGGRRGIVVGVDGTDKDAPAVPWAAAEAAASGDELVLLNAAALPVGAVPAYADADEVQDAVVAAARDTVNAIAARVREAHPDLEITGRITSELPVVALSEAGATASLVVVGSRGLGVLRRFLQGSVSAEVVLTLAGPVAIVS